MFKITNRNILPLLVKGLTRTSTLILKASPSEFPLKGDENKLAYVYKDMGEITSQDSASEKSHIFHIKHKAPYAILLMGESGSGKTTVATHLFPNLPVIHGDTLMMQLVTMPVNVLKNHYPYLNVICQGETNKMAVGGIMIQIFNSSAGKEYACLVAAIGENKDFVYEIVKHKLYNPMRSR